MAEEIQLVVFLLDNNGNMCEYGVPILQVQEINRVSEITRLPQVPDFIEGMINLRGEIIPVIDLKKRFEMGKTEHGENTRIIVFDIAGKKSGIIVDDVSEVLHMAQKDIAEPPILIGGISSRYLTGVGKVDDRLIILLDLTKILNQDEKEALVNVG
jgi:purine-binding chemotaxis protein CheW